MVATGQYTAILAVIQQRLIPSKLNDTWGFELLQAVVQYIPPYALDSISGPLLPCANTFLQI
jgi:exportin-2 (importin alpha re-exporter)